MGRSANVREKCEEVLGPLTQRDTGENVFNKNVNLIKLDKNFLCQRGSIQQIGALIGGNIINHRQIVFPNKCVCLFMGLFYVCFFHYSSLNLIYGQDIGTYIETSRHRQNHKIHCVFISIFVKLEFTLDFIIVPKLLLNKLFTDLMLMYSFNVEHNYACHINLFVH
jgi:hypothetical protein